MKRKSAKSPASCYNTRESYILGGAIRCRPHAKILCLLPPRKKDNLTSVGRTAHAGPTRITIIPSRLVIRHPIFGTRNICVVSITIDRVSPPCPPQNTSTSSLWGHVLLQPRYSLRNIVRVESTTSRWCRAACKHG